MAKADQGAVTKATTDIVAQMAEKYSLDRGQLLATLRKSIIAPKKQTDGNREFYVEATDEEIFVFLQVAREYELNPFIKEVVAFVSKRGAVVPYVTIDGWITLINRNKRFAGLKAIPQYDSTGKIFAYTVVGRIKDKDMPGGYYEVEITELLKECKRNTGPWSETESRMLRHKAIIQWGRVAFGYGGLYDQDEAEKIKELEETIDITPGAEPGKTIGPLMPKALETVPPPPAAPVGAPGKTAAPPLPARTEAPPAEPAKTDTPTPADRQPGEDPPDEAFPLEEPEHPAPKPGRIPLDQRKQGSSMTDDEKRAEILMNAQDYAGTEDQEAVRAAVETFSFFNADGTDYKQGNVQKLKGKWLNTTLGRSREALKGKGAA